MSQKLEKVVRSWLGPDSGNMPVYGSSGVHKVSADNPDQGLNYDVNNQVSGGTGLSDIINQSRNITRDAGDVWNIVRDPSATLERVKDTFMPGEPWGITETSSRFRDSLLPAASQTLRDSYQSGVGRLNETAAGQTAATEDNLGTYAGPEIEQYKYDHPSAQVTNLNDDEPGIISSEVSRMGDRFTRHLLEDFLGYGADEVTEDQLYDRKIVQSWIIRGLEGSVDPGNMADNLIKASGIDDRHKPFLQGAIGKMRERLINEGKESLQQYIEEASDPYVSALAAAGGGMWAGLRKPLGKRAVKHILQRIPSLGKATAGMPILLEYLHGRDNDLTGLTANRAGAMNRFKDTREWDTASLNQRLYHDLANIVQRFPVTEASTSFGQLSAGEDIEDTPLYDKGRSMHDLLRTLHAYTVPEGYREVDSGIGGVRNDVSQEEIWMARTAALLESLAKMKDRTVERSRSNRARLNSQREVLPERTQRRMKQWLDRLDNLDN